MSTRTCPECGLLYILGSSGDTRLHRKYHDRMVHGLAAPPLRSDVVIWQVEGKRITAVNAGSALVQRGRAEEVGSIANKETRYDFGVYSAHQPRYPYDPHAFLLHVSHEGLGPRIVGMLVADVRREAIWKYTWPDYDAGAQLEKIEHAPMWSVGFVWTHKSRRRQGLARLLVCEATRHLGCAQEFGWYTPFTEAGRGLVQKLCPIEFYIAK